LSTELLNLLADGEYHSGQELAAVLGVSRTAVWKQLGKFDALGLSVESIRGKGYRLPGGVQLLDKARVVNAMRPANRKLLADIELHETVDSTNTIAMKLANNGPVHAHAVVAEQQTAGRGRRGRKWISPYASNIYLSLVWDFDGGAAALEGLSLAVGVAMVEALSALGIEGCGLKWPNDVLVGGRKLGGILLEMTGDASGNCSVVIGVGLNIAMPGEAGRQIDQAWVDVRSLPGGEALNRNEVLAALLDHLLPAMETFSQFGFSVFKDRWTALDIAAGQSVTVLLGQNEVPGVAMGVNDSGALQLQTADGLQAFHGGEVSLRGLS
jgi:BirA family biotin operon repressor/biotin-[acetyl-CoA-carboxylase] ligase